MAESIRQHRTEPEPRKVSGGRRRTLRPAFQNQIQSYFGLDFSGVRLEETPDLLHTGFAATASGTAIRFADGWFNQDSASGRQIIAHEFAHLSQQANGETGGTGLFESPRLERRADADAAAALRTAPSEGAALEPYRPMGNAVQPYRLVMPGAGDYTQGAEGNPLFSTHKVVHFPDGTALGTLPPDQQNGALAGIDQVAHQALQAAIAGIQQTPAAWKNYYHQIGRLSDPQEQGNALGQKEWSPVPPEEQQANLSWPTARSDFRVQKVTSNTRMPLLVSEHNQFALNALYPEPKEVYAQNGVLHRMDGGDFGIDFEATGNRVQIAGIQLNSYRPVFTQEETEVSCCGLRSRQVVTEDREAAATHICNEFRDMYYPREDRMGAENFAAPNPTPWGFHTAGKLAEDGNDILSLENGARYSWLAKRLGQKNNALGQRLAGSPEIEAELNKTWYFRMYGPQNLGQDMKEQTVSRFGG